MDVIIIDYKMSNLHSVVAACKKVGLRSEISSDPKKILDANLVILPGVGSFKQAMINLKNLKLETCIHDYMNSGKIFIGICLVCNFYLQKWGIWQSSWIKYFRG